MNRVSSRVVTKAAVLTVAGGLGFEVFLKRKSPNLHAKTTIVEADRRRPYNVEDSLGGGELKLINVQVFFRHGARTPLKHIYGVEEVCG